MLICERHREEEVLARISACCTGTSKYCLLHSEAYHHQVIGSEIGVVMGQLVKSEKITLIMSSGNVNRGMDFERCGHNQRCYQITSWEILLELDL